MWLSTLCLVVDKLPFELLAPGSGGMMRVVASSTESSPDIKLPRHCTGIKGAGMAGLGLQRHMEGSGRGNPGSLKFWIPVAVGGLIVAAYVFFYALSAAESQGATSFGIANSIGLVGVFVALIAAGFIFRRATPHQ